MPETELTDVQKAYNVAQSEMFQLAAYGNHRYHPSGEALTAEGKRQQRDYNDRLLKARADLEAALLRLVAEHGERYRTLPAPVVGWLRTLADDPGELGMLTLSPDERREALELAGTDEETAEPTAEEIVRDHVTTLHLIGEQLANVETWMWEHLADVRAASADADPAQDASRV